MVLTQKEIKEKYIIPTKNNPTFKAECDAFGFIESNVWKDSLIGNYITSTFGVSFKDSVNDLHNWIIDQKHLLKDYPTCKFSLWAMDGDVDKDDYKLIKVYTISAFKARKYLLNN